MVFLSKKRTGVVNAIKEKLDQDAALRAAFKTNSIEFLRRQKLQASIKEAFLSNADERFANSP